MNPTPVTNLSTTGKCPLCHDWEYNPTQHGYGWCVDKIEAAPPQTGSGEEFTIRPHGTTTPPLFTQAYVDAAVQAAEEKYQWVVQHTSHISTLFDIGTGVTTWQWLDTEAQAIRDYPTADALVSSEMSKEGT